MPREALRLQLPDHHTVINAGSQMGLEWAREDQGLGAAQAPAPRRNTTFGERVRDLLATCAASLQTSLTSATPTRRLEGPRIGFIPGAKLCPPTQRLDREDISGTPTVRLDRGQTSTTPTDTVPSEPDTNQVSPHTRDLTFADVVAAHNELHSLEEFISAYYNGHSLEQTISAYYEKKHSGGERSNFAAEGMSAAALFIPDEFNFSRMKQGVDQIIAAATEEVGADPDRMKMFISL